MKLWSLVFLPFGKLPEGDMFKSREEFIADAYLMQGERVAYQDEAMAKEERVAVS